MTYWRTVLDNAKIVSKGAFYLWPIGWNKEFESSKNYVNVMRVYFVIEQFANTIPEPVRPFIWKDLIVTANYIVKWRFS